MSKFLRPKGKPTEVQYVPFSWLPNYREETTQRVWGTTTTKATPSTFVPDLIQDQCWDRNDLEHQSRVAREDPIAHYVVWNIAGNVFDDGFRFVKRGDEEQKEIMPDIQLELKRMRAKHFLTQALGYERQNGHSWLYIGLEDQRTDDTGNEIQPRVAILDAFSAVDAVVDRFDLTGTPAVLKVTFMDEMGNPKTELMSASDFILFRTRPFDRTYMGQPITAPIWDSLVHLRSIEDSMAWYAMKIGIGLLFAEVKGKLTSEIASAIEQMLIDASPRRALVYADRDIGKVGFLQAAPGATDFTAYCDSILSRVAAGSGIPKDVLTGVSAGALTGSEVNSKALYATIQKTQASVEPYIRELVARMGHPAEDYDIIWNTRYATNELEQAEIRRLNAEAAQMEQNTENMRKGINPNDIAIRVQKERDEGKDNNPAGKQAKV